MDAEQTVMARTRSESVYVGRKPSPDFADAIRTAPEGALRSTLLEGTPSYSAWSRLPDTGWTVGIGLPATAVDRPILNSLVLLITVGVAILGGGLLLTVRRPLAHRPRPGRRGNRGPRGGARRAARRGTRTSLSSTISPMVSATRARSSSAACRREMRPKREREGRRRARERARARARGTGGRRAQRGAAARHAEQHRRCGHCDRRRRPSDGPQPGRASDDGMVGGRRDWHADPHRLRHARRAHAPAEPEPAGAHRGNGRQHTLPSQAVLVAATDARFQSATAPPPSRPPTARSSASSWSFAIRRRSGAQSGSARPLRARAGGPAHGRDGEPGEGRVRGHGFARAAHAAQRDLRLGRDAQAGRARRGGPGQGPGRHRPKHARAGAAHRRPARHGPRDPGHRAPRDAAGRPRPCGRGGGRCGQAGGRCAAGERCASARREASRLSRATRAASSRLSGTCSRTRSSSRRPATRWTSPWRQTATMPCCR